MSLNIDMKIIRPVNFSGVTLNLDSDSWTLLQALVFRGPVPRFMCNSEYLYEDQQWEVL